MSRARKMKKAARKAAQSAGRVRAPIGPDPFGIVRESKIEKSNVRNVFTPHQPISDVDLLFGRAEQVKSLFETLNTPGQHVLLYGERGVGKSSLANVASQIASVSTGRELMMKRCDRRDTFATVVAQPLKAVGADLTLQEVTIGKSGGLSFGVTSTAMAEKAKEVVHTYKSTGGISPSTVAECIGHLDALLLVDEADAISNPEDRGQLAELIKLLSDSASQLKVMVVGIAQTGGELTDAHPSVQRCLKETKLQRMTDAELEEIVTTGAQVVKLIFAPDVIRGIVKLSAGYPHFTHLLALKCAEEAIVAGKTEVRLADLKASLLLAVQDAEGTLKRVYGDAVRSASDMYRHILIAAATITEEEFSAATLREAIKVQTGEEITQNALNNFFKRLVAADGSTILRRTGQGHYRFEDPRMQSFIRIANGML